MKKLAIAAALSLFVLAPALAQDAAISIKSRTSGQRPKIIIRSPYDFEKDISLKVRLDPRFIPSDVLIRAVSEIIH